MLRAKCPKCSGAVAVHPAMAGKEVRCPGCGSGFRTGSAVVRKTGDYTGVVEISVRTSDKKARGRLPRSLASGSGIKIGRRVVLIVVLCLALVAAVLYFTSLAE